MKGLVYRITKEMLTTLLTSKHAGGVGLREEEIIPYLNKTNGFRGKIVKLELL